MRRIILLKGLTVVLLGVVGEVGVGGEKKEVEEEVGLVVGWGGLGGRVSIVFFFQIKGGGGNSGGEEWEEMR